ncbi:protein of unknown function DUF1080 [Pirellula staleyi DSM 6068]|uniref:3-keto-alpha-glucoside-1,2-lyase/3-keto-2-hydroxy-glucal hydratase domain-containing protein n=1 Tax=Pirellula staleyi (strain ATCC 27377 / DSM 6068 / ICPB 4128) TaxID=530564 RepID=D2R924_PIRSD|nr:protein of unknown function DUF1080 [Pirellula staleyi DSM 6068]
MIRNMILAVVIATVIATPPAVAEDWQVLFDGTSLQGWQPSNDNMQFELVDGVILGSSSAQTHFLVTSSKYGDFELELEVKLHDTDLNSGVQIRTSTSRTNEKGDSRAVIHGPQVDLGKSPGRSGQLFSQGNGAWITPKDKLASSSAMKNGEWNTLRVLAVGPRIQTWVNGQQIADVTDEEAYAKYPSGVIALQVHGVKNSPEKGRHVSFRSIRIRKIETAK